MAKLGITEHVVFASVSTIHEIEVVLRESQAKLRASEVRLRKVAERMKK